MTSFLKFALFALASASWIGQRAFAADPDEVIAIDFADSPTYTHAGGRFRTLTFNINTTASYPDDRLLLDISNVTCVENAAAALPCVKIVVTEETNVTNMRVWIRNVDSARAVDITVNGLIEDSAINVEDTVGCALDDPCIGFSLARDAVFDDSTFSVTGAKINTYPVTSPKTRSFIHYDIRGRSSKSNFHHEELSHAIAAKDAQTATPVRITGYIGDEERMVQSNWFFGKLESITPFFSGGITGHSKFTLRESTTRAAYDMAMINLNVSYSTFSILECKYSNLLVGPHSSVGPRAKFHASIVTFGYLSPGEIDGIAYFASFNADMTGNTDLIVSRFLASSHGWLSFSHTGRIAERSTVKVVSSELNSFHATAIFAEDCTKDAPCPYSVSDSSMYEVRFKQDTRLTEGAYVSLENIAGRQGLGTTHIVDLLGNGVISVINSAHIIEANFNSGLAGGFNGTLELWSVGSKANVSLAFTSTTYIPRRITMNGITPAVVLKGSALSETEVKKAVLAALYIGCATVYDTTSETPNVPLTPSVPCKEGSVMRRCTEGLASYSYAYPELGYRTELTSTSTVQPCNFKQVTIPGGKDERVFVDFNKTAAVTVAARHVRSLTITVRSLQELLTSFAAGAEQLRIDVHGIVCTENRDTADACVTILIPEGEAVRGLSVSVRDVFSTRAVRVLVEGSMTDSDVVVANAAGCGRVDGGCIALTVAPNASFAGSAFTVKDASILFPTNKTASASVFVAYSLEGNVNNTAFTHTNLAASVIGPAAGIQIAGFIGEKVAGAKWLFDGLRSVSLALRGSLVDGSTVMVRHSGSAIDGDRVLFNVGVTDGAVTFAFVTYNYIDIGTLAGGPRVVFAATAVTFHECAPVYFARPMDMKLGVSVNADLLAGSRLVVSDWGYLTQDAFQHDSLSFYYKGRVSARLPIAISTSVLLHAEIAAEFDADCTKERTCSIEVEGNRVYDLSLGGTLTEGSYALIYRNAPHPKYRFAHATLQRMRGDGVISFIQNEILPIIGFWAFGGHVEVLGNVYTQYPGQNGTVSFFTEAIMPKRVLFGWNAYGMDVGGTVAINETTRHLAEAAIHHSCTTVYYNVSQPFAPKTPCERFTVIRRCDEGLSNYEASDLGYRKEYTMRERPEPCTMDQKDVPIVNETITVDFGVNNYRKFTNLRFASLVLNLLNTDDGGSDEDRDSDDKDEGLRARNGPYYLDIENITCPDDATTPGPCVTVVVPEETTMKGLSIAVSGVASASAIKIDVKGMLIDSDAYIARVSRCDRIGQPCIAFSVAETAVFSGSTFTVAESHLTNYANDEASIEPANFVEYDVRGEVPMSVFSHHDITLKTAAARTGPVRIAGYVGAGEHSNVQWVFRGLEGLSVDVDGALGPHSSFSMKRCSGGELTNAKVEADVGITDGEFVLEDLQYSAIDIGGDAEFRNAAVSLTRIKPTNGSDSPAVLFSADLLDGSSLVASGWASDAATSMTLRLFSPIGQQSAVVVSGNELRGLSIEPAFAADCAREAPCSVTVEGNAIRDLTIGGNTTNGTFILAHNNTASQHYNGGVGTIAFEGLAGTGTVSHIANSLRVEANLVEFEGSLEVWGAAAGDSVINFHSATVPRRVTIGWTADASVNIGGSAMANNSTRASAIGALYFSCAPVFASTSSDDANNAAERLTPSVPCERQTVMRRCDEGLSNYAPSDLGYRNEFTMREHPEPCTVAQRDVPAPTAPTTEAPDNNDKDDSDKKKTVIIATLVAVGVAVVAAVVAFAIVRYRRAARNAAARYEMVSDVAEGYGTQIQENLVR